MTSPTSSEHMSEMDDHVDDAPLRSVGGTPKKTLRSNSAVPLEVGVIDWYWLIDWLGLPTSVHTAEVWRWFLVYWGRIRVLAKNAEDGEEAGGLIN